MLQTCKGGQPFPPAENPSPNSFTDKWLHSFSPKMKRGSTLQEVNREAMWEEVDQCIQKDYENHIPWTNSLLDKLGDCLKVLTGQDTEGVKSSSKVTKVVQKVIKHAKQTPELSNLDVIHTSHWDWVERKIAALPDYRLPGKDVRKLDRTDLKNMLKLTSRTSSGYCVDVLVQESDKNPQAKHRLTINVIDKLLQLPDNSSIRTVLLNSIYHPVVLTFDGENIAATLDLIMRSDTLISLLDSLQNTHQEGNLGPIPLSGGRFSKEILKWIIEYCYKPLSTPELIDKNNVIPLIIASDYLEIPCLREAALARFDKLLLNGEFDTPENETTTDELSSILNIHRMVQVNYAHSLRDLTKNEMLSSSTFQEKTNVLFARYLNSHCHKSPKEFFNIFASAILRMKHNNVAVTNIPNEHIAKAFGRDLIGADTPKSNFESILQLCIRLKEGKFSDQEIETILSYHGLKKKIDNCFNRGWNTEKVIEYSNNISSLIAIFPKLRMNLTSAGLKGREIDTILNYPIVQEKIDGAFSRYLRRNEKDLIEMLRDGLKKLAHHGLSIKSIGFDIGEGSPLEKNQKFIECLKLLHEHVPNLEKISLVGCSWFKHSPEFEPLIMKFKELKEFRFALDYAKRTTEPSEEFEDYLRSKNGYGFDVAIRNMKAHFAKEPIDMIDSDAFWYNPQSNIAGHRPRYWRNLIIII